MAGCARLVDVGRRQFLTGSAASAAAVAAAVLPARDAASAPPLARVTYPSARLANIAELKVDEPKDAFYPDEGSPVVVLKLGVPAAGGVGPEGDVVAFSTLCPHKGFPLGYQAADKSLSCPGHYSRFDCEKGGQQIWGQATQNLPQLKLRVDAGGDIFAEGVDELIYGRLSNVLA